jgi:hypothetical protein
MADKEWKSIFPGVYVCVQCPHYVGNTPIKEEVDFVTVRNETRKFGNGNN